jgi:hypothetical protein
VRYGDLFEVYQEVLGDRVSVRTWDRLIAQMDLADESLSPVDRRRLVLGAANLRRQSPKVAISRSFVLAYGALRDIRDASEMTGDQIYQKVAMVKDVRFRAVQRWFESDRSGVRLARKRTYSGEQLRFIFQEILIRLNARPSKLVQVFISSGEITNG